MKIENVKAVITGAGSGLGEGTARYLKNKGAELLLIDLNADGLKKVADDINCKYVVGDVSNEEEMKNAINDFNEIIAKEVAIAAFILKSERITSIGIIINPPPAPTKPVKKPIKDPSAKIKNLFGAIVLVCFNPIMVFGVLFL